MLSIRTLTVAFVSLVSLACARATAAPAETPPTSEATSEEIRELVRGNNQLAWSCFSDSRRRANTGTSSSRR
jgi:hypothetical protein